MFKARFRPSQIENPRRFYENNVRVLGRRLRWFRATSQDVKTSFFKQFIKDMMVVYKEYDMPRDGYEFIVWAPWFEDIGPTRGPAGPPIYILVPRVRRIRFGRYAGDSLFIGYVLMTPSEYDTHIALPKWREARKNGRDRCC